MKYKLIIKEGSQVEAEGYIWDHLDPNHTSVEDITIIGRWENVAATILSDSHDSTMTNYLNMWMNENRYPPFLMGSLLWWGRMEEELEEEEDMKEENLGPVLNEDGTPTEFTKQMLEDTGRAFTPPFSFAEQRRMDYLGGQKPFGPVTLITADGTHQGMIHQDDLIEILPPQVEDQHLEAQYEDRYRDDMEEQADWDRDTREDGN